MDQFSPSLIIPFCKEALLEVQQKEREDDSFHQPCLFCSEQCSGNRSSLFAHMLNSHRFTIGQPDNIGKSIHTHTHNTRTQLCTYTQMHTYTHTHTHYTHTYIHTHYTHTHTTHNTHTHNYALTH